MSELKHKTARTIKWSTIDRVSAQVIYAAVGFYLVGFIVAFKCDQDLNW